ncbi:MAG: hypothetical protein ACE5GI_08310 [Candidatus Aminicenantales bacterium]
MEEIEVSSWLTLDALKKDADIKEKVGNLQTGHFLSVFCVIEDDYLELCYSDSASNYIRRYEDKEEWKAAIEKRMEEEGEIPYEEDQGYGENYEDEEGGDDFEL